MDEKFKFWCFEKIIPAHSDSDETLPEARSGHRIVVDEGNLYSVGGYNPQFWNVDNTDDTSYPLFRELWRFNFATRRWIKEETLGSMPVELASHSAMLVGRSILMFGGTGVPFGESSSNNVYVYSLERKQWRRLECSGEFPQRKYGHVMLLHNDSLYIVGGTTGYVYNAEVHRLDLTTCQWYHHKAKMVPSGRYRHEAAFDGENIYMLGGGTANTVEEFDKIAAFNIYKDLWDDITTRPDHANGYPAPRRCHGCVQYKNAAYICGGLSGNTILGDLWKLCLETRSWSKFLISMPVPAYFHSVAISEEGCMTIYGGVICVDDVRTSDIYQIWIGVPSLREMCWQNICRRKHDIGSLGKETLHELGIPPDFLNRIS